MKELCLRNYHEKDLTKLADFFTKYLAIYPDAKLNSPEFYTYHPVLKREDNAFCVMDIEQKIVGFAPVFPVAGAETDDQPRLQDIWTIILAEPGYEAGQSVRQLLFNLVVERAEALKAEYEQERVRLASDMIESQKEDIDFLLQQGFEPFEQIKVMNRDISKVVPRVSMPPEIRVSRSILDSEEAQVAYLALYNTCFPANPKSLSDLQFLLNSPIWEKGYALMALSPQNEIVGSILVYQGEDVNNSVMDDVMVMPAWRGRDIAKGLVAEGLKYLQVQGIAYTRLGVRTSNAPAIAVYHSMAFETINHEVLLGLKI